jgi:hypothetical protein
MLVRMLRNRWYRALAAGPVLMLFALAPSVLSIDHWAAYLGLTVAHEEELDATAHAEHCHLGPATCSGQPLPPDLSATPAVVHVVEPELTYVVIEDVAMTAEERVVAPPTDPPRA